MPVAAGVGVDPGAALDVLLQPSCYGDGFAVPGRYQVLFRYETPMLAAVQPSTNCVLQRLCYREVNAKRCYKLP